MRRTWENTRTRTKRIERNEGWDDEDDILKEREAKRGKRVERRGLREKGRRKRGQRG